MKMTAVKLASAVAVGSVTPAVLLPTPEVNDACFGLKRRSKKDDREGIGFRTSRRLRRYRGFEVPGGKARVPVGAGSTGATDRLCRRPVPFDGLAWAVTMYFPAASGMREHRLVEARLERGSPRPR